MKGGPDQPPDLAPALDTMREAWARCRTAEVTEKTAIAACIMELLPQLIACYGRYRAALVLEGLGQALREEGRQN